MKTLLRKPGMLAMLLMFASLFATNNVSGQIQLAGGSIATAVQSATTNTATLTINRPTGLAVGDVMIANIVQSDNDGATLSDATRLNWLLIDGRVIGTNGGDEWWGTLLYKIADAADVAAASFAFTLDGDANNDGASGGIVAFRGVNVTGGFNAAGVANSGPFDVDPGTFNTANSSTVTAIGTTTVTPDAAVIMFGVLGDNNTITGWQAATGPLTLTELYDLPFDASLDNGSGAAWALKAAAGGTGNGTATQSNTDPNGGILVALRPMTITTGAIVGSPFCVTASTGAAVSVPFTSTGTYTGNTYTAQLSNAAGSFASPVSIGTSVSNANSGSISATIPANTVTGTGYRIRVISSSPVVTGTDNGSNLTINLASASIAPTATQNIGVNTNGNTLTVTEGSTPISREWFYGTVSGGPYGTATGVTTTTFTPNFPTQGTFYVVAISTFSCATITSNQVQINVSPTIATNAIVGSPFCVTALNGAPVSVDFTSAGTFNAGNVYTAQLSNASGSFTSPTDIGTLSSTANSGTISATIPAGTPTGTGYRIRVVSSDPSSIVTDNGTDLTINLATASVTPAATQNIGVNTNGTTLTVTENPTAVSREWFYGTVSGGPYGTATGVTTTTFTPNFAVQGTYYVVSISTFACGTVTSNEVQIIVSPTIATNTIVGSPFCVSALNGAPVSVDFTSAGVFNAGNIYTAQLSNASGSFATPVNIGTLSSTANSGTISATIPAGTASGTGYRIRVVSSDPASVVTDNGTDLTITLATASIAPTATQNINVNTNGTTLTVTENPTAVSREWFYGTVSGGPYGTATGVTTTTFTPNFAVQGTYYVVAISTFDCGTATSNQVQINVSATVSTNAIVGSPFCVTLSTGAPVSVDFTSAGTFNAGNIYTAQLSNASGSFATPVNIGTLSSTANSGTISATIPAGTATGTGYRIRVISSDPTSNVTDNGSDLTINLAANSIAPTGTQNITTGANGTTLTVTEQSTPVSREWFYGTTSGGPYTTATGVTGTTYTPNFVSPGTYYIVAISTFTCGTVTSNQVQVNVTTLGSPQTFNSSGTVVLPPGVTCAQVEAWGGGGRGGSTVASANEAGGAGGGAYSRSSVIASGTQTVTVGAGSTTTAPGGDSWFSTPTTILAKGGNSVADNATGGATGGAAASGIGDVKFSGGTGANGSNGNFGGGGGSSAGIAANGTNATDDDGAIAPLGGGNGGNGGNSNPENGDPGIAPGGGGGGVRSGGGNQTGGAGANGRVIVSWIDVSSFSTPPIPPICQNVPAIVTVNSTSLGNGTYEVGYTLSGANTGSGTATLNFSGGTGTFSVPAAQIPNFGNTTVTVNTIAFVGGGCSQSITNSSVVLIIENTTATLTSAAGTDAQTVCLNTAITNITYSIGVEATGATVSGLPNGVTGVYSAGVVTISGTPTTPLTPGVFTYTVTPTGTPCVTPVQGTITVIAAPPATVVITGSASVCSAETLTYSTPAVFGSTYTWGVPAGWSIN